MKDSLLLPVLFVLLLLLCLVLFTVGYILYLWDIQYVPSSPPSIGWAASIAPAAMRTVFIPAALAALFLLIMRIARRPGVPLLSYLLPLAALAAVLYFGITGLDRLYGPPEPPAQRSYDPLIAANFNLLGAGAVYPTSIEGNVLGPTVVVQPQSKQPFTVEQSGRFEPKSWSVIFAGSRLTVEPPNPALSRELAPRSFLVTLFGDMAALSAFLENARHGPRLGFLIAVGGVALFSAACIAFAWLTRWPLLNVFLVAVCFRGLFWLFSLFSTKVAADAFALVLPSRYLPVAPAIGLGALGVVFLIWNLLFIRPPARD